MRCSKARKYYFRDRDELLGEAEKMRLEKHLSECDACLRFKEEMDGCLELLADADEPELPENFEWNVKRRIAQERTKIFRQKYSAGEYRNWGLKFSAAAAVVIVAVLAGAWYYIGGGFSEEAQFGEVAGSYIESGSSVPNEREEYSRTVGFTNTGYPTGLRMVSDDMYDYGPGHNTYTQIPSNIMEAYRVDYLIKENQLLRDRVMRLKRENVLLKNALYRYSKR